MEIGAYDDRMADVWFVLVVVAFFGVCVALVWGCDRIIGPDDVEAPGDQVADASDVAVTR